MADTPCANRNEQFKVKIIRREAAVFLVKANINLLRFNMDFLNINFPGYNININVSIIGFNCAVACRG